MRRIIEVKTMVEIQQIVASYNRCGSYSQVAKEFHISRNIVKKWILRVNEFRSGIWEEIIPLNRAIKQPRRVITNEILTLIHSLLEQNRTRPRKQRMNAWQISDHVAQTGYVISYATVKRIIASWNK